MRRSAVSSNANNPVQSTPANLRCLAAAARRAGALGALVLAASVPVATHAQSCVPGSGADWMLSSDPLAARVRPAECAVVEQSPPDFGWPSTGGSYQLTLTFPDGSTKSVSTTKNWLNWNEVLPAGTYTWQVTSNGTASRARQFTVGANAVPFVVPPMSSVVSQLSAKPRPRGLPDAGTLATMQSQRSGAVSALIRDVKRKVRESLPGVKGGDPTLYSEAALKAVAAAVYSNQGSYYNEAIRRVMDLAAWDPQGQTAYGKNVMGSRAVSWALAVGYDWLHPRLSAAQRSQILAALKVRVGDMHADIMNSIERHPRNSYGNQSLVVTAVIAALVAPDLPEATTWLNETLPLALNAINPWAAEEGGFSNSQTQGFWDVGEQLLPWYVLRWSTGIDLAKKAWVKNWARYMAYFAPIGTPAHLFGDALEVDMTENRARFGKGYTFFAPSPLGRWYASKLTGEDQTGLEYLMAPPADFSTASFPAGTPNSAVLSAIGQVAMHSDLADPARTSVYFKSSPPPYGAYNRSHADQNSFVVNAGGQRLAIESGYYDSYQSAHWTQWYHQTRAKNAITYDNGQGQLFYEQGGNMGYGALTRHVTGADYEIVTGDATQAYGGALKKAQRSMIYLRPNLILVYDNLASDVNRQWEWNIHALNQMSVISDQKISIQNNGQSLCVDMLGGPAMRFAQTNQFTASPTNGGAPQWHGKFYNTTLATTAEFVALLRVGCATTSASAAKSNGVWNVQVADKTVQISDSAITVSASTTTPPPPPDPGPAPGPAPKPTPYSGTPVTVPATLEAENFDKGGQGVAYNDTTPGNAGGLYRTSEDVDIIASSDAQGGGHVVNNFASGEWLAYTINVPSNGEYVFSLRAANDFSTASAFHIEVDGVKVTGNIPVPMTGGWTTFQSVATPPIALTAGTRVVKVVSAQQYFDLNSITVTAAGSSAPPGSTPYSGTPVNVPATIEAENFDKGGQGVAYKDTTPGNLGLLYRTTEDVDLIVSTDSLGGGYVVNNFATGEWLNYTINVPTSGQYVIQLRASNAYGTAPAFHIEIDGVKVTGSIPVPNTGGWTNFQWVATPAISLSAGKRVLKVVSGQEYFNLNSISVADASSSGGGGSGGGGSGGGGSGSVQFFCTFANSPKDCGFAEQAKVSGRATLVNFGRDGNTAVRLHTEVGDNNVAGSGSSERNDLTLNQSTTACYAGAEHWWAQSIYFPSDFVVPPSSPYGWYVVSDFHHTGSSGQANFHVEVVSNSGLRLRGYGGATVDSGLYQVVLGPIVKNQWYDFVYHVKWSSGSDGFFNAWLNGKKVLSHKGPTLYNGMGCYLKLANYHSPFGLPSSVIHDRVIRGTSASAVSLTPLEGVTQ